MTTDLTNRRATSSAFSFTASVHHRGVGRGVFTNLQQSKVENTFKTKLCPHTKLHVIHAHVHTLMHVLIRTGSSTKESIWHYGGGVRDRGEVDVRATISQRGKHPTMTCCTSAVVDTAQINSDEGQLGLVPQCEANDY